MDRKHLGKQRGQVLPQTESPLFQFSAPAQARNITQLRGVPTKAVERSITIECVIITETSAPDVFDTSCITVFHNSLQNFTFPICSRLIIIIISIKINSH